ncbi:MAG: hypothetical protein IVW55_04030 [Chloroflexi bacterium]|nr:hypothetical protein [Chloroflexota bacterium]
MTPDRVCDAYVRAQGGASGAAQQAVAGRAAAGGLGRFLSGYAGGGLAGALEEAGLGHLIGQDRNAVILGLADALVGANRTLEESAARDALLEVLQDELGEEALLDPTSIANGALLDAGAVGSIIEAFIAAYIYARLIQQLGRQINEGAPTIPAARRVEEDLRAYIKASVHLDLRGIDPVAFNWNGPEGAQFVDGLMHSAHEQLRLSITSEV